MDSGFKLKLENPRKKANIFSKLFFGWMIQICYKGTKKGLEIIDLYKVLKNDKSDQLGDKMEKNWLEEVERSKKNNLEPSLIRVISKTFFWNYMIYGILLFIQTVFLKTVQPVVLSFLLKQFSEDDVSGTLLEIYLYGSVLIVISIFVIFLLHHCNFEQSAVGMRIRISLSSLIYRKIMRINKKSLGQTAAGQVVNLLSNDLSRFDFVMLALHYLWIMPFQVVLATYFIWQEVGISSLAGVLSMAVLTLPVQAYLGKLTSQFRLKVAQRTDTRVKLMSEIISGIQVIKMYAWEKPFELIIKQLRKREIDVLTKTSYLRGIYLSCMVFIERSTLFLTIVCFVLTGNDLTANKVFSLAQFFNILQLAMAIFYPMAISYGAETLVSIKRVKEFLMLQEKNESLIEPCTIKEIKLSNLSASWTEELTLKNLNIHLKPGALCAIVGPVGAGKSSILQLLLNELPVKSGRIQLGGQISYSCQEPWLFASTVRQNILFGQEYNKFKYKQVVKVCALIKDFDQFPQGDKTIVGERGVSLSGGQRARINLARAVYRTADIYLLDDPLSAVDTHVGRHLFDECIFKYLKDQTRILVTHQLQYLKKADHIVVLNEGSIEAQGTFSELSDSNLDFTKLLIAADETEVEKEKPQKEILSRRESVLSSLSMLSETMETYEEAAEDNEEVHLPGVSPFWEYFKATKNLCALISLVTILILGQVACSSADFWVAYWTEDEELRHKNPQKTSSTTEMIEIYNLDNKTNSWEESYYYTKSDNVTSIKDFFFDKFYIDNTWDYLIKTDIAIYIYTFLIIAAIVITLMRSFLFFKVAMWSSKNLHNTMFHCLLEAPMRFFDTNPSGRVLNRFSKDMGAVDELLPRTLLEAIQVMLVMMGILVNVVIANYYLTIAIIVLGAAFVKLRGWYIATAKDVKHLEGIAKSPVFSHVSSSLNGLTTIRSSKAEDLLTKEFDHHQDVHTSAWYITIACIDCYGLWLDIICVLFVAVVTYSFIIIHHYGHVSSSLVGLAISQSLILTGMLQYGMRQTAEVINQLTSVERILQYTKLEVEGPFKSPLENKPKSWPKFGQIEFYKLSLKYGPYEPLVLKNLSFNIKSAEKIGIVGRTGAGKSSLISAMFRLTPLEGAIIIDQIDTNSIGLHDLRKKISIIPQEPVLFSATLRYNLDPFNEYDDQTLWNALEEVELRNVVHSLDFQVSEGGSNFSLGQRQLLCLARAIVRNNKVLVLDEATANVDPQTDTLIQTTIRRKFADCTVLTIAHRLNTIMDSDRVLVMSFGEILEFDHPFILLQNPEGHFTKMVLETGTQMSLQLRMIAYEAFEFKET